MPSRSSLRLVPALLLLSCATALAAPLIPGAGVPKLDPQVSLALDTGLIGPWVRGPLRPGRAKALLELSRRAGPAELDALTAAGVQLVRVGGRALAYDRFVPVELTHASLAQVVALPWVVHIASPGARGPMPLDRSAQHIRLAAARGARPDLGELTGQGVVIGDVDSLVDPFHPTFFRGDGGYFDWIDTNKDGVLTPGVDAIDLDRDGVAGPGEVATLLPAAQLRRDEGSAVIPRTGPAFDPGIDWLYLDSNGNGERDYGMAAGFDDSVPALGEPLFTPDDVNRNGKLDVGERVVRLSTSKFKKIFVELARPTSVHDLFERGVNLAAAKVDYTGGAAFGFPDALHATGVTTILAGDVPLIGRRSVGMAPDADLLVAFDAGNAYVPVDGATWALDEGANVMLYELAPWYSLPLDGSDPLSHLIDTSALNDGVVHTCPTGDQGMARKHAHAMLTAGTTKALPFDLPATTRSGQGPLHYVGVSINSRGGVPEDLILTAPSGDSHSVRAMPNGVVLPGGAKLYASTQMTMRGTSFTDVFLYAEGATSLEVGTWTLSVAGDPTAPVTVDAYVADDVSSWAMGAAWDPSVVSERSTIGIPSVADHCIAVNAFPDHLETAAEPWYHFFYEFYDVPPGYAEKEGEIRAYSPRGPRIDGLMKPDITAPDNPWVATEHAPMSSSPYGSMRVFGGTSGASPHVTGVAALLWQAGLRGDAVRDAIRKGAIVDSLVGTVPNSDYGYGRLDAAAALGRATDGKPFTITLTVDPAEPRVSDTIKLSVNASGDGEATMGLEASWDDGYDGSWDAPFAALSPHVLAAKMPGHYPVKVRVRNAGGHYEEAIMVVTVGEPGGGCGCQVGGQGPTVGGLMLLALALLFLRRARRRSQP